MVYPGGSGRLPRALTWNAGRCCGYASTNKVDDVAFVRRRAYEGCREGSEVVLYQIRGGGHTWPGRPAAEALLGVTTGNVSANDVMWDFFTRHPMR